jgi:hypothetical protein
MIAAIHGIMSGVQTSAYDADAQAFITASGITDTTQKDAINTLVLDLKGASLWTKMSAIYPFVGGTASTHKWNLKDARDLDAAFRLVFSGGWTHSANGGFSNGTTGYADTKFNPSVNASSFNGHLSYYSRTDAALSGIEIGSFESGKSYYMYIRYSGNLYRAALQRADANRASYTSTTGLGFFNSSLTSSSLIKSYRNGSLVATNTATDTASLANYNVFIGAFNNTGSASAYVSRQCAFSSIGEGLTDAESATYYTAVQAFQTSLSRQV